MANLTIERKTDKIGSSESDPPYFEIGMAANVKIFAGAIVVKDAAGDLRTATQATGLIALGSADTTYDNTGGATAAVRAKAFRGVFLYDNSSGDPIAKADIGNLCYIEDDHTVSKGASGATRSAAGFIWGLDPNGGTQIAVGLGVASVASIGPQGATGVTGATGATGASLLAFKNDVNYLDEQAVAVLASQALDMRLSTWAYKWDAAQGVTKPHLGIIIDDVGLDSPAVAASADRVDPYAFASMVLALAQTQQRQIDELKAQVAALKGA